MSWTKKQIIGQAYEIIGAADFVSDLTPEQQENAVRKLDMMVAGLETRGVRINYKMSNDPDEADINDDSGVPAYAVEALYLNLAPLLAPAIGMQTPPEVLVRAKTALTNLMLKTSAPTPERQITGLPGGAGDRAWYSGFPVAKPEPLQTSDNNIQFN